MPYQDFPTADGGMIVAVGNDAQFAAFCRALGQPDWAADERFTKNRARVGNRVALTSLLRGETVKRTTAAWIAELEKVGVPCGPINTLQEVYADPQVVARNMRFEMPHPTAGTVPQVASPLRLSRTPVSYRAPPPTLGQHTSEVLAGVLGLSGEAIAALSIQGIV